jgi:hypothetical protein
VQAPLQNRAAEWKAGAGVLALWKTEWSEEWEMVRMHWVAVLAMVALMALAALTAGCSAAGDSAGRPIYAHCV